MGRREPVIGNRRNIGSGSSWGWALLAGVLCVSPVADAMEVVGELSATLAWTAASGPVASYRVAAVVNDSDVVMIDTPGPSVTIEGFFDYGDSVVVAVRAIGQDGQSGPLSESSDPIVFVAAPAPNMPPMIANLPDRVVSAGVLTTIAVTASDADGDGLVLTAENLPDFGSFEDQGDGEGEFLLAPDAFDVGSHVFTLRAADDGTPVASATKSFTIEVVSGNRSPAFAPLGSFQVAEGGAGLVLVRASDPEGTPVMIDALGLPAFATLVDLGNGAATLEIAPDYGDDGAYELQLRVIDSDPRPAFQLASLPIVVSRTNRPPVWQPAGPFETTSGAAAAYGVEATDPDGDALTLELESAPAFVGIQDHGGGQGTLQVAPGFGAQGSHPVAIRVRDDGSPSRSALLSHHVVVTGPASLTVQPAEVQLVVQQRDGVVSGTLAVANGGGGPFAYSVASSTPRLIAPRSGFLESGETELLEVQFDVTALSVGRYQAQLTLDAGAAFASPQVVVVVVDVFP